MSKKVKEFKMDSEITKPLWFLKPIMDIIMFFYIGPFGTRSIIRKHNFKDFKEPTLIISNHGSFVDFAHITKVTRPYYPCYIAAVDEFAGREWLMRNIGCIPKRKFTTDLVLIKKMVRAIQKEKMNVVLYPEARWTLAGVTEKIGDTLGKMAKLCKCRVVVMNQKGNFLRSPVWNKHPYRKVRAIADCYEIASKEEVLTLPAEEIQRRIEEKMQYDEYKWQATNKVEIKSKKRAENIHRILYKCSHCNTEGKMNSKGSRLWCEHCNASWQMDYYGLLNCENKENKFTLVSDWYRWEREEVIKEVNEGTYYFEDEVRLEKFINSKVQFKEIGKVKLTHDERGFILDGTLNDGSKFHFEKPCIANTSVHIEFDYRKRGDAIDIATLEETWFAFPLNVKNQIIKFNFAAEALYEKVKSK